MTKGHRRICYSEIRLAQTPGVRIKRINFREIIRAFFFAGSNETVRYIRVSLARGSTVLLYFYAYEAR